MVTPNTELESDAESESSAVTPRTTRSKAKESPLNESKSKDKSASMPNVKCKSKESPEESEKTDKISKGRSVIKEKCSSSDFGDVDEKDKTHLSKDTISELGDITENFKGKTNKSKCGKVGKAGNGKCKSKTISVKSEDMEDALMAEWADKRPTPSMDYNETNAKCPLPGCDSKGKTEILALVHF